MVKPASTKVDRIMLVLYQYDDNNLLYVYIYLVYLPKKPFVNKLGLSGFLLKANIIKKKKC